MQPLVIGNVSTPSIAVACIHLQVLQEVTGKPTLYYREGGTIPAMALLKKELDVDMTMFAFGLPDDRIHAPNERYAQSYVRLLSWCSLQASYSAVLHGAQPVLRSHREVSLYHVYDISVLSREKDSFSSI